MRLFGWTLGHERQRELLSAHLDGQLSQAERRGLERHLESCAVCRAELDGLRATVALLRAVPAMPLRRSFTLTPAMAEAEPPPPLAFQRPTLLPPAMLAGARYASAAAAVLLVGVVSYDVAGNVMPSAQTGVAGQATASRAFEQLDAASKAAPPPVPASAPAQRQSAPSAPAGGAGGNAESAASPPVPRSFAPPAVPGAAPAPAAGPTSDAGTATAADTTTATLQARTQIDTDATAGAQPASGGSWLIHWLEAALASLLASASAIWWWGRRPA